MSDWDKLESDELLYSTAIDDLAEMLLSIPQDIEDAVNSLPMDLAIQFDEAVRNGNLPYAKFIISGEVILFKLAREHLLPKSVIGNILLPKMFASDNALDSEMRAGNYEYVNNALKNRLEETL